jgi:hypothetical protein
VEKRGVVSTADSRRTVGEWDQRGDGRKRNKRRRDGQQQTAVGQAAALGGKKKLAEVMLMLICRNSVSNLVRIRAGHGKTT